MCGNSSSSIIILFDNVEKLQIFRTLSLCVKWQGQQEDISLCKWLYKTNHSQYVWRNNCQFLIRFLSNNNCIQFKQWTSLSSPQTWAKKSHPHDHFEYQPVTIPISGDRFIRKEDTFVFSRVSRNFRDHMAVLTAKGAVCFCF